MPGHWGRFLVAQPYASGIRSPNCGTKLGSSWPSVGTGHTTSNSRAAASYGVIDVSFAPFRRFRTAVQLLLEGRAAMVTRSRAAAYRA
jgi:hypothetical protein